MTVLCQVLRNLDIPNFAPLFVLCVRNYCFRLMNKVAAQIPLSSPFYPLSPSFSVFVPLGSRSALRCLVTSPPSFSFCLCPCVHPSMQSSLHPACSLPVLPDGGVLAQWCKGTVPCFVRHLARLIPLQPDHSVQTLSADWPV